MNTIPVPLQNVLRQRYQSSLLLEKRDEGIERQYKKIKYLPEPPEQQYKGPPEGFGNQVTNRLKEIGSDPYTYASLVAAGILALPPFTPVTVPIMAVGGAGMAIGSAATQVAEDDYGAAAVDVGLGLSPFGSKGVRGTFGSKGSMVPQAGRIRTAATEPPVRSKAELDVLAKLRKDLEARRFDPVTTSSQTPYYTNDFVRGPYVSTRYPYKDSNFLEFEPWQFEASEAMAQVAADRAATPWQSVMADMENPFITPRPRRRGDGAGEPFVSEYNRLSRRDKERIRKSGTPSEKEALERMERRKLGKALGGELGDTVARSESPFMKEVIKSYYDVFGGEPSEPAARALLGARGIEFTELPRMDTSSLKSTPIERSVVPTIVSYKKPSDYSNKKEYIDDVERSSKRKLNAEEIDELGRIYDADVSTQYGRDSGSPIAMDAEKFPRLVRSTRGVEYIEPAEPQTAEGPIRAALRKAAAAATITGELATGTPKPLEIAPQKPPTAVDFIPATYKETVPSTSPVKTTVPSVPSSSPKPSTTSPGRSATGAETSTGVPVAAPKVNIKDMLKDSPKADKPTTSEDEVSDKIEVGDEINDLDKVNYTDQYFDMAPAIIPAAIMARAMANTSTDAGIIGQRPSVPEGGGPPRFKIIPSSGGGRRYNQGRDTDDLVAMIAPSAEELRTALKRGQLGAVSGYYQLA